MNEKNQIAFDWHSVPEARQCLAQIRQMQKEIKLLRKDLKTTMTQIRSLYTAKNSTVQAGFIFSLAGKKSAGHDRAMKREKLHQRQHSDLAPYEYLDHLLDEVLVKLDATKMRIQASIDQDSALASQQARNPNQPKPSTGHCEKCGAENPAEYRFCGNCGTPLLRSSATS